MPNQPTGIDGRFQILAGTVAMQQAVLAAATTNVASLSGPQTIDDVAVPVDANVLLAGQTDASQNGPWVVKNTGWVRPYDYFHGITLHGGILVWVMPGGTLNGASLFYLQETDARVIDTDATTWLPFFASSTRPTPAFGLLVEWFDTSGITYNLTVAPSGSLLEVFFDGNLQSHSVVASIVGNVVTLAGSVDLTLFSKVAILYATGTDTDYGSQEYPVAGRDYAVSSPPALGGLQMVFFDGNLAPFAQWTQSGLIFTLDPGVDLTLFGRVNIIYAKPTARATQRDQFTISGLTYTLTQHPVGGLMLAFLDGRIQPPAAYSYADTAFSLSSNTAIVDPTLVIRLQTIYSK